METCSISTKPIPAISTEDSSEVLDCAEKHYLRTNRKKRRTNAEKALHNLRHKPLQTFAQVSQKVTSLKIDARVRYIADWWTRAITHALDSRIPDRLGDKFILGFYHQVEAFYKFKEYQEAYRQLLGGSFGAENKENEENEDGETSVAPETESVSA